jgi:hypothetical protein
VTGFLWRWALLLSGLFLLPLLLIRAQPYDDGDLREFLTPPPDCPAPCFMGIRPGVTGAEEAITILENHAWVQTLKNEIRERNGSILVEWSPAAPPVIDRSLPGRLRVSRDRVYSFHLKTTYHAGATNLIYDTPQGTDSGMSRLGMVVSALFMDHSVVVHVYLTCPVNHTKFWSAQMDLTFSDLRQVTGLSPINFIC